MPNPNMKKGAASTNPSGRPKGIPNKTTQELRNLMQSIFEHELPNVLSSLERVRNQSDARYVELMLRLAEYHIPKATQQIDLTTNNKPINILSINPLSTDADNDDSK